jgi:dipeptidyl aminopeptidase/acylaminoacyl peptidase
MLELELEIEAVGALLSGTLCLPSDRGPMPAVLMLPGSGPMDRNENMEGQCLNTFNTFAHQLAEIGFASLRYDKRGCGKSTGEYFQAGYFDFVEDAVACFDRLKCHSLCASDQIYALGHSEGTLTAMHVSLQRHEMQESFSCARLLRISNQRSFGKLNTSAKSWATRQDWGILWRLRKL